MASPHVSKLRIFRSRRFWFFLSGFVFLTAFWLGSASYYAGFGHSRSWGILPLHTDYWGMDAEEGCIAFGWGSRSMFRELPDNPPTPPAPWVSGCNPMPYNLEVFPKLFVRHSGRLLPDGHQSEHSVTLPLWLLPLAWSALAGWRMNRLAMKNRESFASALP